MSERIYACLLRLFPSCFREAYGEAALQLFRDRARDERGFFQRLRLWMDLLFDFAISLPREYSYVQPRLLGASAQHLPGVPSFFVLENESVRPGVLLLGATLSLVAVGAFSNLLNHLGNYEKGMGFEHFAVRSSSSQQPGLRAETEARTTTLDKAERQRVVDAVSENLKTHYADPEVARKIADTLVSHQRNGDYDAITDGETFADLLTRQMRDVSHDMHLDLLYSQALLPASRYDALGRPLEPTPEGSASYRKTMEQSNCTFEKVEILPHNIGYLKLNSFPDPSVCQETATAAMVSLNHADAILFDLRDNRGGSPDMVSLIAAYLFDHPEYMYNPREAPTLKSWTLSPVSGSKLADKPVYILTSARSFSGAEQFSYDLKMLKRSTLVGETTGGAAHAGVFHRIDDHFGIGIPEVKAVNPFSNADWAGAGVEPDVKVNAADALETAVKLAESKLLKE
jgi:Peptidase family S41/N-terminal domain of Peptidase_S41 in eukaryotic IRBP